MSEVTRENLAERLDELSERILTPDRMKRFRDVAAQRLNCLTVAFENFYDPHNVSAGIRSCEVFGCPEVYVYSEENFKPNRSTASHAHRWLDVHRFRSVEDCTSALHEAGYTIVGTLAEGEARPFTELALPERLCIWMGPEKSGMGEVARAACDDFVTIPMAGFTQSLNVSAALTVLTQHFSAAYRKAGITNLISSSEQEALVRLWCERDLLTKFGWL